MEQRQLGGIGFIISNAALFLNGLIASRFANTPQSRQAGVSRMVSSGLWSGTGAFLTAYGDRPAFAQQERLEEKLAEYLKNAGVPLDAETLRKANASERGGMHKKIEDFFYAHPIECSNAYYALSGAGFAYSGKLRRQDGNVQAGNANLGLSGMVMTGALASILIPEKTPEQVAAQGQSGTLWGNMQEHPLGYVRWLFMSADALTGLEALGEYKAASKLPLNHAYRPWQFGMAGLSVVAMVTSLIGDWMTSGSKKVGGTPEARAEAQNEMLEAAANHLRRLPKEQQKKLVHMVCDYLSKQHELRFSDSSAQDIEKRLLEKISAPAAQTTAGATPFTARLEQEAPAASPKI